MKIVEWRIKLALLELRDKLNSSIHIVMPVEIAIWSSAQHDRDVVVSGEQGYIVDIKF